MKVTLQYGRKGLAIDLQGLNVTVLAPKFAAALDDEAAAFFASVRRPLGTGPLREVARSGDRLAIVIPDSTRPLVTDRLLRWTLRELDHVPAERITIVNGTGSHRANSEAELASMVGGDILSRFRVVNHDAHDPSTLAPAGRSPDGRTVYMNRDYVEADRRIVLGFIEPHFMAGFSGGYKGVFPALADIDSIMRYHGADVIGNPGSTWGRLEGNPTQDRIRANGSLLPVDFCINVTQNRLRQITGIFAGEVLAVHARGCEAARVHAMTPCARPFAVVVTTNSGYPLDQNLYQAVKGMSAAARIVSQGGYILCASECEDGFPGHGNFRKLLFEHNSPGALLETIHRPGYLVFDQWEAQILALIRLKARVGLYSRLDPGEVRRAWLEPVEDIEGRIREELAQAGGDAPVAVLPEGPMTIPFLS